MSTQVPPSAEEPLVYRPLSGLAVAGFAVSAFYALIILYMGFRALRQGDPLLMEGYWLLLPLAGIILSLLGQAQIRNSEGTRAGFQLTRWGLGLSVCFGLGYFVYALGTGLAIRQQANRFLMELGEDRGFFAHLQQGDAKDLNAAFLLTVPPGARGRTRPENEADMRSAFDQPDPDGNPGKLTEFRGNPLVLLFQSGAEKEIQVDPLGVMEWRYGKDGFLVRRVYRVTTEDTIAQVLISTKSAEGREGETRRWHVVLDETWIQDKELTPLGKNIEKLRIQAAEHVQELQIAMNKGAPWTGFAAVDDTRWEEVTQSHELRTTLRERVNELFEGTGPNRVGLQRNLEGSTWRRDRGKLKILIPITLMVADPAARVVHSLNGEIEVSTTENIGPIQPGLRPEWEITRIAFLHLQGKGPPMGPPGS